jgi:hypothetical protein
MKAPEQVAADLLNAEIRDLQELQRMAGVPRLFSFMCAIVDGARNGAPNGQPQTASPVQPLPKVSAPNGLSSVASRCAAEMRKNITVSGLTQAMRSSGYVFVTKTPKLSVSDFLRTNVGKKVKITKRAVGTNPTIYEWIG